MCNSSECMCDGVNVRECVESQCVMGVMGERGGRERTERTETCVQ